LNNLGKTNVQIAWQDRRTYMQIALNSHERKFLSIFLSLSDSWLDALLTHVMLPFECHTSNRLQSESTCYRFSIF